jgi:hypothetical protein
VINKKEIFHLLQEIHKETQQLEDALRQDQLENAKTHIQRREVLVEKLRNNERSENYEDLSRSDPDGKFDVLGGVSDLVTQLREIERRCREEMEDRIERITDDLGEVRKKSYIHRWLDSQTRIDRSSFIDVHDGDIK